MDERDAIQALKLTQQEDKQITVGAYVERLQRVDKATTPEQAKALIDQFLAQGLLHRCAPVPSSRFAGTDEILWELTEAGFDA